MKFFDLLSARVVPWVGVALAAWVALPAVAGSRFVPNAVGDEVADTATGLIWRRCVEGQTWDGNTCTGTTSTFTWDGALAQAQSQASQSGQPWRVPNKKELASLVNRSRVDPAIDTKTFPNTHSAGMWSSTPEAGEAGSAWLVDFYNGYVDSNGRNGYGAVRLVRVGQ